MKVLTEERKQRIFTDIDRNGVVQIRDLIAQLDASESTVRRDLGELAKEGLLRRVHGGAQKVSSLRDEPGVQEKATTHTTAKAAIARAAANMVQDGDLIFLDAGTTTAQMVPLLQDKDVTVVTTGVDNASLLADYGIKTIMIGGTIKPLTKAMIGAQAAQQLAQYRFNSAFIGANSVHIDYGCTTPDPEEAATKRVAISQAACTYTLADASKFGNVSFAQIALVATTTIITDDFAAIDPAFTKLDNIKEATL